MSKIPFASLALVAALGACSGESAPTFSDPIAALDAAESAQAAGDTTVAEAGFNYALANGDDAQKSDAQMGLFKLELEKGDEAAARSVFEKMRDGLDADKLVSLTDMVVEKRMVDLAEEIMLFSVERYPDTQVSLTKASEAIELLRTQGPDADLSGLGYAGD